MIRGQDVRVSSAPTQQARASAPLPAQGAASRRRQRAMTTSSSYLERATTLAPVQAERAVATEQPRRLLPETVADLKRAGCHRMAQPRRFGGAEAAAEIDCARLLMERDLSEAMAAMRAGRDLTLDERAR